MKKRRWIECKISVLILHSDGALPRTNWLTIHTHYWGVPHRASGGRVIHVCYECGKQRKSILGESPSGKPHDVAPQSRVVPAEVQRL